MLSQKLFFSILFLSSALFLTGEANINIGAIVNTTFRIGREQKVAMEIAARRFNSSSSPIFLGVSELNSSDPFEVITRGSTLIPLVSWIICFFVANGMRACVRAFVGLQLKISLAGERMQSSASEHGPRSQRCFLLPQHQPGHRACRSWFRCRIQPPARCAALLPS